MDTEKVKAKLRCDELHHGICKHVCGAEYAKTKRLWKSIFHSVDKFEFYTFKSYADSVCIDSFTMYCATVRAAGPQIAVFVECTTVDGCIRYKTETIAGRKRFLKKSHGMLTMMLSLNSLRTSFCAWSAQKVVRLKSY